MSKYKVYAPELGEVKHEGDDFGVAVSEALEWAEWDDIKCVVYKGKTQMFVVDGYGPATEVYEALNVTERSY